MKDNVDNVYFLRSSSRRVFAKRRPGGTLRFPLMAEAQNHSVPDSKDEKYCANSTQVTGRTNA